ncbi:MAG: peroxiredoxin [Paracoccaceae bacterium]|jgi:peroxiredoxin
MAVQPPMCEFGWQAPGFSLPSTDGRVLSMPDVAGPNGALVVFMCNHCPYVLAVLDRILRDARDLAALGIGVAAICSNDAAAYPEDGFERMARMATARAFPFPYLHDESQHVARAWGAACTPDFFGFDAGGGLQYRGRLDASRKEAAPDGTPRDLFDAMAQVAATGRGPRAQIPSVGCSIKWKDDA